MSNLRNSAGFFILVVLVVAVAASLVGIYFPEAAIDILQRGIGSACGVGFLALGGWGLWLVQEKALYGGWQIEIIDPQAKQEFDPLPAEFIKQLLTVDFSDWGPHGWVALCESLDRRENLPEMDIDGKQARQIGVLGLYLDMKRLKVDYTKLPKKEALATTPGALPSAAL